MPTFNPDTDCTLTTDLKAFWKLDEASGIRFDSINPGTDNAAQFTAANSEYLSIADNASISTGDIDFTIAGWINPDSIPAGGSQGTIFQKGGSGGLPNTPEYNLIQQPAGSPMRWRGGDGGSNGWNIESTTFGEPVPGNWIFIVCIHDSVNNVAKISVNNGAFDTQAYSFGGNNNTGPLEFGRRQDDIRFFDGRMDSWGLWKKVLTAQEITDLYNSGNGRSSRDLSIGLRTSLEAYWDLDETSGTRVDAIGSNDLTDNNTVTQGSGVSGNNLTDNNTVTQAEGIVGSAAQFVFANSEDLNTVDNADLSVGDIDFTIAAWVYLDTTDGGRRGIVTKYDSVGASREYSLEFGTEFSSPNKRFTFFVSPDGAFDINDRVVAETFGTPTTGVFTFIVAWHDATANTLNIQVNNGTVDSIAYTQGIFDGTAGFQIGNLDQASSNFWNGRIDEVGIWKKVLTTQERTDLYNSGNGNTYSALRTNLLGYWKLEEASGTRLDAERLNDLTDNNTVTQAVGIQGNAGQFTRANTEYLSISDNPDLSVGDIDFTIAAWVYLDSKPSNGMIIVSKGDANTNPTIEYSFQWNKALDRFQLRVGDGGSNTGAIESDTFGSPSTGIFIFIVCWHDATANTLNIQVNNGTVDSAAYSFGSYDSALPLAIGRQPNIAGNNWDGRIDEVGIWKRVLTSQERTDLYNSGAGTTLLRLDNIFAIEEACVVPSPSLSEMFLVFD